MWDWQEIHPEVEHEVEVKGKDLKQLLSNFLEEIIYLLDSRSFLLSSPENIRINKEEHVYRLKARFRGDYYSERYKIYGDVKAITYNEMEIESNDRFMIQVVVDV